MNEAGTMVSATPHTWRFSPAGKVRAAGLRLRHWLRALAPPPALPDVPALPLPRKLAVVAPHPDDEWAGAGGLLAAVTQAGGDAHIVVLTDGGAYRSAAQAWRRRSPLPLGEARRRESLAFAARIGLSPSRVRFFDLPDRGLAPLWERPPERARWTAALAQQLADGVDAVVFPHPADEHPDHWAAGLLTLAAALVAYPDPARAPLLLAYVIHVPDWPDPRGFRPRFPLLPPAWLGSPDWRRWTLTPAQVAAKRRLLDCYRTQTGLPGERFYLGSFARRNELFEACWIGAGAWRWRDGDGPVRTWAPKDPAGPRLRWQLTGPAQRVAWLEIDWTPSEPLPPS